jgi:hypothetical protein
MPLISVLGNTVQQSAIPRYERLVRFIAERARQDSDTFKWSARVNTGAAGRSIHYVTRAEGFAELSTREEPDAMIRRLFGEADGTALVEALGEGTTSTSYLVAAIRDDLSSQAPPEPGETPPLILLTRIRTTHDGGPGVEELIRKVGEAASKVGDERRTLVLQTTIGELRTYAVAQSVSDPAQLDQQATVPELLLKAFGESEGERIFSAGTACIEHVETELSTARPDLSNEE